MNTTNDYLQNKLEKNKDNGNKIYCDINSDSYCLSGRDVVDRITFNHCEGDNHQLIE